MNAFSQNSPVTTPRQKIASLLAKVVLRVICDPVSRSLSASAEVVHEAKQRQQAALKQYASSRGGTNSTTEKGKARDQAAKAVGGVSGKYVSEAQLFLPPQNVQESSLNQLAESPKEVLTVHTVNNQRPCGDSE